MIAKVFTLAVSLAFAAGCGTRSSVDLIPASERVPASEIKAKMLNGPDITLAELKGKVVVVDFWATWCGPCRMEIPSLVKIYNEYHSRGVEVLGLSVEVNDGRPVDYFKSFLDKFQVQYPVGLASMDTIRSYGINPIPAAFFIDRSGRVALSLVGARPEADLTGAVEKLLAE